MHDPDDALRCFHLYRQRQCTQALRDLLFFGCIACIQPLPAVHRMIDAGIWITDSPAPSHQIMITANSMEPRAIQPIEHMVRFWSAINQIAHREKPIFLRRKPDFLQHRFQLAETSVNVAHSKIPAFGVDAESLYDRAAKEHAIF